MQFRIREVDGDDEAIRDDLLLLQTFAGNFPKEPFDVGHWWIATESDQPAAYASLKKSTHYKNAGYLMRVGVLPRYRGHGLQRRLMRACEMRARKNGWVRMVSDTTDAVFSANNFIRLNYKIFDPLHPWSFPNAIYWTKDL